MASTFQGKSGTLSRWCYCLSNWELAKSRKAGCHGHHTTRNTWRTKSISFRGGSHSAATSDAFASTAKKTPHLQQAAPASQYDPWLPPKTSAKEVSQTWLVLGTPVQEAGYTSRSRAVTCLDILSRNHIATEVKVAPPSHIILHLCTFPGRPLSRDGPVENQLVRKQAIQTSSNNANLKQLWRKIKFITR